MKTNKYMVQKVSIAISLILMLIVLTIIGHNNFTQHRDTIVRQQQEHLLTIAKSVGRSIDAYFDEKANGLSVLAQNPIITQALEKNHAGETFKEHEEILKTFFNKSSDDVEGVQLINEDGSVLYKYPLSGYANKTEIDAALINQVLQSKEIFITQEYESGTNKFSIDILQPVINRNKVRGIIVSTINLNRMYESLIFPIRPGKMGYAMVKNMKGVIVMHPVKEQVGIEALKDRKEKFPDYNWNELEELYRKQVTEQEGYHVYHSNWWQDDGMKWSKKINAYTTIRNGDVSWIISVQMDYSEIEAPMKGNLLNISLIALVITVFLLTVTYIIFRIDKKRKALEIETRYLKELNKTWEELIKSEARLRHSQKLQTIGTLTSGIAHEFNNLLTPILGYSEILLQGLDEKDSMQEDIGEIRKSALRAKEIIEQILVFSRNDQGMAKIEPLVVDEIVGESIKMVKSILPNNIKIVENIHSHQMVKGNATQLQQVLINLYTNSYHAMKARGGQLEVCAESIRINAEEAKARNLKEGMHVKLQVKDTGIGMDKETLNQVFDPFFTTKEIGEGTGLGMSVVHGIIKSHKGSINIKSQINIGTTVEIYLPEIEDESFNEIEGQGTLAGQGNVFVVDDNDSVLRMIEKGLKNCGYHVTTESEGFRAMKAFDKDPLAYDVAILDYSMPNMSGVEIGRYFKLKNPKLRIILISGYLEEGLMQANEDLFDDYLPKPIIIAELVNKIKKINS